MTSALTHQLARALRDVSTTKAFKAYSAYHKASMHDVWEDAEGNTYKDIEVVMRMRDPMAGCFFVLTSLGADRLRDEWVQVRKRATPELPGQKADKCPGLKPRSPQRKKTKRKDA